MRILITTDLYLPAVNGVVTSVVSLVRGLRQRGHDVRIVTLSDSVHTHTEGNVTYLGSAPADFIYPGVRARVAPTGRVIRDLVLWHPDVVHSQCEFSTFGIARKVARICGAVLLHTYHTVYEDYTHYFCPSVRVGRALAAWFTRRIAGKTDGIIAPTEKVSRLLGSYRVTAPVTVIPTGAELSDWEINPSSERAATRRAFGLPPDGRLLLYLGRLAEEKNIGALLTMLEAPDLCGTMLILAGDGPYRGALREKVCRMGLTERVRFLGMIPHTEVNRVYRMADVFVNASRSETQGLTYAEAMAAGLPVVCRADPCVTGLIVNGETGFACETEAEMAVAVRRLLTEETLRRRIVAAARKTVDRTYSAAAFAAAVEQLYLQTIPERGRCAGVGGADSRRQYDH